MRLKPLVLSVSAALTLTACGAGAADDGRPTVVASFYPLQYVTEQVGGDLVQVDGLTQPGGEAHDLELTPRQVGAVQDADVVVFQSDFQTAVDEAVEQADREQATTVDAASVVTLVEESDEDDHADDHGDEEHGHEHADEEEGPEHAEDEGHDHGHDHGGVDPHVWLDPTNVAAIAEGVEQALAEADPDNAETYATNAERLVAELTELDEEMAAGLERCEVRDIVTSHAAFAYLAERYDLVQVPIAGIDPGNEPSGAQLAEIADLVQDRGITTVFTERLVSPAIARTVAEEAGVQTATLDPIEGLTEQTSDEDYQSLMRQNLAELQKANNCS